MVELTYNWDEEDYAGGRNFGHLAYRVNDIYALCKKLMDGGVTINRPPRDGHMAFVRSPDGISIELLQEGAACRPPSLGSMPKRERGSRPARHEFRQRQWLRRVAGDPGAIAGREQGTAAGLWRR